MSQQTDVPSRFAEARRTLACLALLASVGFMASWFIARRRSSVESNAGITIVEDALDFGEAWVQESFEWTLPFHNSTDQGIEVVDVRVSCNCVEIEPTSFPLPPKQTVPVHLSLNLMPSGNEIGSQPLRDFSVRIVPVTKNTMPGQLGWELRGSVRSPVYVSASVIDFAENLVLGQTFKPQSVTVKCHAPMQELKADCDSDLASAELIRVVTPNSRSSPGSSAPGEYEVRVTPSQTLPEGRFDFRIQLMGKTAEGESFPAIPVRVVGRVVSDVRGLPESLRFGTVAAGDVVEGAVELFSLSGDVFAVSSVKLGPNVLGVEPASSEPAMWHVFRIKYEGTGSGQQQSSVTFQTHKDGGESRAVRVPITSYVVSQVRVLPSEEAIGAPRKEEDRDSN